MLEYCRNFEVNLDITCAKAEISLAKVKVDLVSHMVC